MPRYRYREDHHKGTGFTGAGLPELPPLWAELYRAVAQRWPVPVFWLAVVAAALFLWLKPRTESLRPWREYVDDARRAFRLAELPEDEQSRLRNAISCLAGENVPFLAEARRRDIEAKSWRVPGTEWPKTLPAGADAAGPVAEGLAAFRRGQLWGYADAGGRVLVDPRFECAGRHIDGSALVRHEGRWIFVDRQGELVRPEGVHGVLASYDRAIQMAGRQALAVEDIATIGESYYYVARMKADHPSSLGRLIEPSVEELLEKARLNLGEARDLLEARARTASAAALEGDADARQKAERLSFELQSAGYLRRRRMWAEAQFWLGRHLEGVRDLEDLAAKLNAGEVSPKPAEAGSVYEQLGRGYAALGNMASAIRWYRLSLQALPHGRQSQRVRLRLADTLMDETIRCSQAPVAMRTLSEVLALCRVIEESDAASSVRESAAFLRGRALYRAGILDSDRATARSSFRLAAGAFRGGVSVDSEHVEMSRLLLARALFLAGQREEGQEIVNSVLRIGARPAVYACAEVSYADMLADQDAMKSNVVGGAIESLEKAVGGAIEYLEVEAQVRIAAGRSTTEKLGLVAIDLDQRSAEELSLGRGGAVVVEVPPEGAAERAQVRVGDIITRAGQEDIWEVADLHRAVAACKAPSLKIRIRRRSDSQPVSYGYVDVVKRIRALSSADIRGLVPELSDLLADSHFVAADPEATSEDGFGSGQLLGIARRLSKARRHDQAARIYSHILESYPGVARDQYAMLLADSYAAKAAQMDREPDQDRERRWALRCAAASYMRAFSIADHGPARIKIADACWQAGKSYYAAQRYDASARTMGLFSRRFANDSRSGEALYLFGESLRRVGNGARAVSVFSRCHSEHPNEQFGYWAQLALGETYLEMGLLGQEGAATEQAAGGGAIRVFTTIVRDARYTPESALWLKALLRLGETHYLLGRRHLHDAEAALDSAKPDAPAVTAARRASAVGHFRSAVEVLEDAHRRCASTSGNEGSARALMLGAGELMRSRRMLGLAYLHLGRETGDHAQLDRAEGVFQGLLAGTDRAAGPSSEKAEHIHRDALLFLGIIQLTRNDLSRAINTFSGAQNEFARTHDAPWLAMLAGMSQGMASAKGEASRSFDNAEAAFEKLGELYHRSGRADDRSSAWLLGQTEWSKHLVWLRESQIGE